MKLLKEYSFSNKEPEFQKQKEEFKEICSKYNSEMNNLYKYSQEWTYAKFKQGIGETRTIWNDSKFQSCINNFIRELDKIFKGKENEKLEYNLYSQLIEVYTTAWNFMRNLAFYVHQRNFNLLDIQENHNYKRSAGEKLEFSLAKYFFNRTLFESSSFLTLNSFALRNNFFIISDKLTALLHGAIGRFYKSLGEKFDKHEWIKKGDEYIQRSEKFFQEAKDKKDINMVCKQLHKNLFFNKSKPEETKISKPTDVYDSKL